MPAQILRLAAVLKVRVKLFFKRRRTTSAPKMTNGVNQVMILELSTEGGGYVQFIGHTKKIHQTSKWDTAVSGLKQAVSSY